ncbi:MAG: proton-conducting transporter membrane subunit [Anaerolineae bacterium]
MPPLTIISLIFPPTIYLAGHWKLWTARVIALATLGVMWILFISLVRDLISVNPNVTTYTQGIVSFHFDYLSVLITAVVLALSTLITVYSMKDIHDEAGEEKYYALVILLVGSVTSMVCAGDLFNLWMWFEITGIACYLLVAFYSGRGDALAACAKYFIQAATGSIVVLFGIALVFAQTGSLDLAHIHIQSIPLMIVLGVIFIFGFGVKLAIVPLHSWLPDAYSQAPTGISALLSGAVTISSLVVLLRMLAMLSGLALDWGSILVGFGTVNIVAGNLLALAQKDVKRILAYSSVSHIGFILLAVGIGLFSHEIGGFQSGMLHLVNHAVMKALAFIAVGTVIYARFRPNTSLMIDDLAGLSKRDPITTFGVVIACLSLVGIPLLAGFMSKWQIFAAGIATANPVLIFLIVFAALNSVFSLAYYFPIINAMFLPERIPPRRDVPVLMRVPIVLLTAGVIILGIYPDLLNWLVIPAGQRLMILFGG